MSQNRPLNAYFISDIHLRSQSEPNGLLLLSFLNRIKSEDLPTHLFLVGDIFDLWLGDHQYFIDAYSDIIFVLKELKYKGVEIHYFEGNHDLHLKNYWRDKLDFFVHDQAEYFDLGGYKVRVEHGDQTDPDDTGYLFLRWFLRTPPLKIFVEKFPGKLIALMGERASSSSRKYTTKIKTISNDDSLRKFRNHALRRYEDSPFDYFIGGHIHIQDDYEFELDGKKVHSINLGTWLKEPVAYQLRATGGKFIKL